MFNWKKLGMIYKTEKYAQSPQVLIFDNFIRIYFCTRYKDNKGIYLSNVEYIDVDKNFKILNKSTDPIIKLGDLGCFDEHGIFPFHILKHKNLISAYTTGWSRRESVPDNISIGLATSLDNGKTFSKYGSGPILTNSKNQPFLICDPFIKVIDNVYHMWYIFGLKWIKDENPERLYKIGHAISNDGINWNIEDEPIISDSMKENECQALPSVIKINNKYHMFFCYRNAIDFRKNKNNSYRIGHAYSDDLKKWTRDDNNVGIDRSDEGWDSEMLCYPFVFKLDDKIYMLYNGNHFGKFGFGVAKLEETNEKA